MATLRHEYMGIQQAGEAGRRLISGTEGGEGFSNGTGPSRMPGHRNALEVSGFSKKAFEKIQRQNNRDVSRGRSKRHHSFGSVENGGKKAARFIHRRQVVLFSPLCVSIESCLSFVFERGGLVTLGLSSLRTSLPLERSMSGLCSAVLHSPTCAPPPPPPLQ